MAGCCMFFPLADLVACIKSPRAEVTSFTALISMTCNTKLTQVSVLSNYLLPELPDFVTRGWLPRSWRPHWVQQSWWPHSGPRLLAVPGRRRLRQPASSCPPPTPWRSSRCSLCDLGASVRQHRDRKVWVQKNKTGGFLSNVWHSLLLIAGAFMCLDSH